MLKYVFAFAGGFISAKVITQKNVDAFKNAALKSYVVVKDEFSAKTNPKEAPGKETAA